MSDQPLPDRPALMAENDRLKGRLAILEDKLSDAIAAVEKLREGLWDICNDPCLADRPEIVAHIMRELLGVEK